MGELAQVFGAQCVVLAIDARARADGSGYEVVVHGGRVETGREAVEWAREGVDRGAGEILLTSMDRDGTEDGYELELTRRVADAVDVPVIASGGAGTLDHLVDAVETGGADAVLCASIFHYGRYTVQEAKERMADRRDPRQALSARSAGPLRRAVDNVPMSIPSRDERARRLTAVSGMETLLPALEGLAPTYLVGGAVRDLIRGEGSADLDLAVEGDAAALATELAARLHGSATVHERFGTATVRAGELSIDLAGTRRETYARPGALPTVAPAGLDEDLRRRDFSINAMALALARETLGELIDPHGGADDLDAGLIRVLHDASFTDDPTRILRALRYATRLGFTLASETEALLREAAQDDSFGTVSGPARSRRADAAVGRARGAPGRRADARPGSGTCAGAGPAGRPRAGGGGGVGLDGDRGGPRAGGPRRPLQRGPGRRGGVHRATRPRGSRARRRAAGGAARAGPRTSAGRAVAPVPAARPAVARAPGGAWRWRSQWALPPSR